MKACEIVEALKSVASVDAEKTCDTYKAGDPRREVKRIAVCMMADVELLRRIIEWGADLLVVHEPLYYNHMDHHSEETVESEKRALIEGSGMVVFRYHDYPHRAAEDMIHSGMLEAMRLEGKATHELYRMKVELDAPTTPEELARKLKELLRMRFVRVAGAWDQPCTKISCVCGAGGGMLELLKSDDTEILIGGENREWDLCEYARDAAALGHRKSVIMLGHIASEREGMRYISQWIEKSFPETEVRYFESDEVYRIVV